ncbi:unnamed protein product [Amoebophrya sp. A120]|nr:unnamed protein product [Amoebophrya sp. A120]|eukprot:GSA120T00005009001.1
MMRILIFTVSYNTRSGCVCGLPTTLVERYFYCRSWSMPSVFPSFEKYRDREDCTSTFFLNFASLFIDFHNIYFCCCSHFFFSFFWSLCTFFVSKLLARMDV